MIERNKKISKRWRCGVSIPVPLACKANALPYELHPHTNKNKKGIEYPDESTKKKEKKILVKTLQRGFEPRSFT